MSYLVIKNVGECPVEGFITLGLSSARGNASAIGQFGSGSKHGVLTLLRMGINPVIYTGKTRIDFHTEHAELKNGVNYNKVFAKIGQAKPRELSMCLEYGAIDWTQVDMGLREFVSNALDACNGCVGQISVKIADKVQAEAGHTVVGVPLTPDVQRFYLELHNRFLQFAGRDKYEVLPKDNPGPAHIFRKGVFVRKAGGEHVNSLFDYNFGDDVPIDEARNMDDYACQTAATKMVIKDKSALKDIFHALATGKDVWETKMGDTWVLSCYGKSHAKVWQEAWEECFGHDAVAMTGGAHMFANSVKAKGYKPVIIETAGWYDAMVKVGIPTGFSVLDNVNDKGHAIYDATPTMLKKLNDMWDWIVTLKMHNGKTKPEVKGFRAMMQTDGEVMGYYKDGVVYIGMEYENTTKVMIEELAHYVTGYYDCTREFQDWAFRLSAAIIDM